MRSGKNKQLKSGKNKQLKKIDKEKLAQTLSAPNIKKIGNFIFKERSQRFSLNILFTTFMVSVLFISVVLIMVLKLKKKMTMLLLMI